MRVRNAISQPLLACGVALIALSTSYAADFLVTGSVLDSSGRPITDAIVAHVGRPEVLRTVRPPGEPQVEQLRSDKDGRFKVTVASPAIVIRKPGFVSERVMVPGDRDVRIVLRGIGPAAKCAVEVPPSDSQVWDSASRNRTNPGLHQDRARVKDTR